MIARQPRLGLAGEPDEVVDRVTDILRANARDDISAHTIVDAFIAAAMKAKRAPFGAPVSGGKNPVPNAKRAGLRGRPPAGKRHRVPHRFPTNGTSARCLANPGQSASIYATRRGGRRLSQSSGQEAEETTRRVVELAPTGLC